MAMRPITCRRPCATAWRRLRVPAGRTISAGRGAERRPTVPSSRSKFTGRWAAAPASARQHALAHQVLVDRACGLPAFADGPDDERLSAPHVARHEDLVAGGSIIGVVGAHVAAPVEA